MSKIDEAKLDEFVNIVKAGDTDTIVCVAYSGEGKENVFFYQGTGHRCLAASAVAHHMVAEETGEKDGSGKDWPVTVYVCKKCRKKIFKKLGLRVEEEE